MNITLLSGEYPPQPGGIGDYTRRLAKALSSQAYQVTVITIRDGALLMLEPQDDQTERIIGVLRSSTPLDWSHRCWPFVIAALDQLRPSWLHLQYQTGAYAMRPGINLLPWRLRQLKGRPRIAVTFHDLLVPYLFPKAGPLRGWINRRLAADADAVIATNTADTIALRAQLPGLQLTTIPIGSNIAVVPPQGFSPTTWRATLGVTPQEFLVAYFGLLSPSKGVDQLVAALAHLERPWRLLLIGGAATAPQDVAYARQLYEQIKSYGLTERTIITGQIADTEVSAHLLAADCIALPFRDGASFRRGSLLAALAHGCPVITTPAADPTDAGSLAEATITFPPDNTAALTTTLDHLADTPEMRQRLGQAGRTLAARFGWDAIAAQHAAVYGMSL